MSNQKILDQLIKKNFCDEIPELKIGEKIKITVRSTVRKEKGDYYSIPFEGVIIGKKNQNRISYSITLLKKGRTNIRTTFFPHSPLVTSIKREGKINRKIRRAKLYYLEKENSKI